MSDTTAQPKSGAELWSEAITKLDTVAEGLAAIVAELKEDQKITEEGRRAEMEWELLALRSILAQMPDDEPEDDPAT
jgi:hypothetical protein